MSTLARLGKRCVFTDANAAASYASASEDLSQIASALDWQAMAATDWRDPQVKTARQAEFLVEHSVPWSAIEVVVAKTSSSLPRIRAIIARARHQPLVRIERSWYDSP